MCDCNFDIMKESKRIGRAHYVCPHCGEDCTLLLVCVFDAEERSKKLKEEMKNARLRTGCNARASRRANGSSGSVKKAKSSVSGK